ncbi:hypothetical protein [Alteribacter aurantiacus]|uniref:hypothetical protein n=1 Tax=Alteribacter aurantiacus TaxID=254410 RepID=UPI00041B7F10|nr:hypothetical protein [Alteribacter aurantiacus]
MNLTTKLLLKYLAIYLGLSFLIFFPLRQIFESGVMQIVLFILQFAVLLTLVVRYYGQTKHLHDNKE